MTYYSQVGGAHHAPITVDIQGHEYAYYCQGNHFVWYNCSVSVNETLGLCIQRKKFRLQGLLTETLVPWGSWFRKINKSILY